MSGAAARTVAHRVIRSVDGRPLTPAISLLPLRRGPGDPTFHIEPDGTIWRTSRLDSGPVTYRVRALDAHAVDVDVRGPGGIELLDIADRLLGVGDDDAGFTPDHPALTAARRRHPHVRLGRTDRVLEALVPAILEQRVTGKEAFASWRQLVTRYGGPAPGPAPAGMKVAPSADTWRTVPSWGFHRAGVDPGRAKTIVRAAGLADRLEKLTDRPASDGRRALQSLPGIGIWTAAEVAQRAWGDPDALSVGDFHLSRVVGVALTGSGMTDEEMVAYLEPMRPHRYRVVRLLELTGLGWEPRRAPRAAITDHRRH